MNNRVVLAFFGDQESRAAVARWSSSAEVVAVALDLAGAVPLTELRDGAIAAGAMRCHALDVREEYAREALLPVVRSRATTDSAGALSAMALDFVTKKLEDIARLENAVVVPSPPVAAAQKTVAAAPVAATHLQIAFEDGVPVAVNGIPMTLTELMESVETITGEPALTVLQREYAVAVA